MIKFYPINFRFFLFIALSILLIEIAGFIFVGKEIGIFFTLSLVILTTIVGGIILRIQGIGLLKNIQRGLIQGHTLEYYIINDASIVIGAILLILPGFVSDIIGVLFLIKPVHTIIWYFFSLFGKQNNIYNKNNKKAKNKSEKIIDLQAEEYHIHSNKESPWRKNDDEH